MKNAVVKADLLSLVIRYLHILCHLICEMEHDRQQSTDVLLLIKIMYSNQFHKVVSSPTGGSRELTLLFCLGICTYSASHHFGNSLAIMFTLNKLVNLFIEK